MSNDSYNLPQEEINFDKLFKLIWRNLWLFIVCIVLAVGMAFVYNKFSIPVYKVSTSILIKEESSEPFSSGMNDMFSGNLFGGNKNLQNELLIIQSNPIIKRTIINLDLEVGYYEYKNRMYQNTYKISPFKVMFYKEHDQIIGAKFLLQFNSNGSFNLSIENEDVTVHNFAKKKEVRVIEDYDINIKGKLGQVIENDNFKFIILLSDEKFEGFDFKKQFAFNLRTVGSLTQRFSNRLKFSILDKNATVIEIALLTSSIREGKDILDELVRVYSKSNLDEKNHIANMTIGYIEQQLKDVSKSLVLAEDSLQRFLSKNKLVDVEDQASGLSTRLLDLESKLAELMTQKRYFTYVSEYLASNNNETQIIAPSSMGIQDALLNMLIMDLSTAQSTKSNLIQNGQERNPIVQRLSIQISNLKMGVTENINSAITSNNLSVEEMQKRISQIERELRKIPKTQLQLGGIQRSFKLNDAIYNYLLQKHAEAKITKASNLPDNIVVATANVIGNGPVSPNKNKIYAFALILGIGIPFAFLSLILLFKQKIETREDLERISDAPILGTILHSRNKKETNLFRDRPQSNIAESYRALRTNLNFFLKSKKNKTILITSTVAGEGKSFNALNIASSYAGLGCKTILVNCDMRKATKVIEVDSPKVGLSTYLSGKNTMKTIIVDGKMDNLDYIGPGAIPPNPMELIASSKVDDLLDYLKTEYEIVVLDGTPLAQVTDSINLVSFSDVCLLVTRYKVTNKKLLKLVLKDLKYKGIGNVALILNDNRLASEQYGYGYGYYEK